MTDDEHRMLEEIRDNNLVILEVISLMWDKIQTLATQASLDRVEDKVDTLKVALTHTNKDLKALDKRVTRLEQAI